MIKLLAMDIDGTILPAKFVITEKIKIAVKKAIEKGVKVVLVTGRMHKSSTFIAEELGINTPIISYGGALVQDKNEVLFSKKISYEKIKTIIDDIRHFDVQTNIYIDDEIYSEHKTPVLVDYCEKRNIKFKISPLHKLPKKDATKILAIGQNEEITNKIQETLQKKWGNELCIVKSLPTFCEIINKNTSKGDAISYLANKWNIKHNEIMAIGDQDNDIKMLEAAHIKVAMGNASEGLKEIANYIAPDVEEDGAAFAIEKFILGEEND